MVYDVSDAGEALQVASEHIRVQAEAQLRYAETMRERIADCRSERDELRAAVTKILRLQPDWQTVLSSAAGEADRWGNVGLASALDELRRNLDAAVERPA